MRDGLRTIQKLYLTTKKRKRRGSRFWSQVESNFMSLSMVNMENAVQAYVCIKQRSLVDGKRIPNEQFNHNDDLKRTKYWTGVPCDKPVQRHAHYLQHDLKTQSRIFFNIFFTNFLSPAKVISASQTCPSLIL